MKNVHPVSIGNAFIWAAAILAAAILTRGTDMGGMLVVILGGAAGASVIIVSRALGQE